MADLDTFRYVTGNPDTPYVGADFDSDADAYVPIPGELFSNRLPAFYQLDLRVDKHWIFDTWRLTSYLEVQNVTNHGNAEYMEDDFDSDESAPVNGLPIIPSFDLRGDI